jgi:hypothetical protein
MKNVLHMLLPNNSKLIKNESCLCRRVRSTAHSAALIHSRRNPSNLLCLCNIDLFLAQQCQARKLCMHA